jgi:hypothetical protein
MKHRLAILVCATVVFGIAGPAAAWGDLGHEVTALIAYRHLTPAARARLDALLASDTDTLTAPDFASRATWADKYRNSHRETAGWHFVDIETDHPDLVAACFGFPQLAPSQPASQGPSQDCVVNKINQFSAELRNPATSAQERRLALKFLIHFVGDLHQPLHAADHQDRGGNCIGLAPPEDGERNLHAYWDTGTVEALGSSAQAIAAKLNKQISARDVRDWSKGDETVWAQESFEAGRAVSYQLPSRPTCAAPGSVALTDAYKAQASKTAAVQLEKAGVRLAAVLNRALGH